VIVADQTAPFAAQIEQVGMTFYLALPGGAFQSVADGSLAFEIPLVRWCAATGYALDTEELRSQLAGEVRLVSPTGASWRGTIRLVVKRLAGDQLPGFLPIEAPPVGERIEVPVSLER
jgi:hypothetical protein